MNGPSTSYSRLPDCNFTFLRMGPASDEEKLCQGENIPLCDMADDMAPDLTLTHIDEDLKVNYDHDSGSAQSEFNFQVDPATGTGQGPFLATAAGQGSSGPFSEGPATIAGQGPPGAFQATGTGQVPSGPFREETAFSRRPRLENQIAVCENNYTPYDGSASRIAEDNKDGPEGLVRVLVTSTSSPSGFQLGQQNRDTNQSHCLSVNRAVPGSASLGKDQFNVHFDYSEPGAGLEYGKMSRREGPVDTFDIGGNDEEDTGDGRDRQEEECWRLMDHTGLAPQHSQPASTANWFTCIKNLTRPASVGPSREGCAGRGHRQSVDGVGLGSEPCVVVTGLQSISVTRPRTASSTYTDISTMPAYYLRKSQESQIISSEPWTRKTSAHVGPPPQINIGGPLRRQSAIAGSQKYMQPFLTPTTVSGDPNDPKTSSMASLVAMTWQPQQRSLSQQWNMNPVGACPPGVVAMAAVSPTALCTGIPTGRGSSAVDLSGSSDYRVVNNPLYDVSNEFMRVTGYKQQFKRLLSRSKPQPRRQSSAPTACFVHRDSFDNHTMGKLVKDRRSIGAFGSNHELQEGTTITASAVALGGRPPPSPTQKLDNMDSYSPVRNDKQLGKQRSAYGRLWKEHPNFKHRLRKRKRLFFRRIRVSDFSLIFAFAGILLTIVEAELSSTGVIKKSEYISILLRGLVSATTVILISLILYYHAIETRISVIDSGAEDWRVAITYERIWQCAIEVLVCSVCPLPAGDLSFSWDRINIYDHRTTKQISVPLDAVLSIPMFLRSYLLCRFMALHSRQFQDAATRSIAALNHIAVNFTFVLKTLMHEHPLRVLIIFTAAFWVAMAWILTQCERYKADGEGEEDNHYLNSIWFVIITFMSIGYGDIVPNTYCGRALAITTGIVGGGVSSALIAVISRKLELSRAEKHVNQFMTDSKLTRQRKEAAAAVLQHTWFIHKYKNIPTEKDDTKLRVHQRKFLAAINEFRRVKWDQRKLAEQGNALVDVAKLQNDMHETLWDMQQSQDHLVGQLSVLMQKIQELQDIVLAQNAQTPRVGQSGANRWALANGGPNRIHQEPLGLTQANTYNPAVAIVEDMGN